MKFSQRVDVQKVFGPVDKLVGNVKNNGPQLVLPVLSNPVRDESRAEIYSMKASVEARRAAIGPTANFFADAMTSVILAQLNHAREKLIDLPST